MAGLAVQANPSYAPLTAENPPRPRIRPHFYRPHTCRGFSSVLSGHQSLCVWGTCAFVLCCRLFHQQSQAQPGAWGQETSAIHLRYKGRQFRGSEYSQTSWHSWTEARLWRPLFRTALCTDGSEMQVMLVSAVRTQTQGFKAVLTLTPATLT